MTNESSSIDQIERQLSKLESTATNLQTLSVLATRANRTQEAKALSDQAVDLRVKQFILLPEQGQASSIPRNGKRSYQPLNSLIMSSMRRLPT